MYVCVCSALDNMPTTWVDLRETPATLAGPNSTSSRQIIASLPQSATMSQKRPQSTPSSSGYNAGSVGRPQSVSSGVASVGGRPQNTPSSSGAAGVGGRPQNTPSSSSGYNLDSAPRRPQSASYGAAVQNTPLSSGVAGVVSQSARSGHISKKQRSAINDEDEGKKHYVYGTQDEVSEFENKIHKDPSRYKRFSYETKLLNPDISHFIGVRYPEMYGLLPMKQRISLDQVARRHLEVGNINTYAFIPQALLGNTAGEGTVLRRLFNGRILQPSVNNETMDNFFSNAFHCTRLSKAQRDAVLANLLGAYADIGDDGKKDPVYGQLLALLAVEIFPANYVHVPLCWLESATELGFQLTRLAVEAFPEEYMTPLRKGSTNMFKESPQYGEILARIFYERSCLSDKGKYTPDNPLAVKAYSSIPEAIRRTSATLAMMEMQRSGKATTFYMGLSHSIRHDVDVGVPLALMAVERSTMNYRLVPELIKTSVEYHGDRLAMMLVKKDPSLFSQIPTSSDDIVMLTAIYMIKHSNLEDFRMLGYLVNNQKDVYDRALQAVLSRISDVDKRRKRTNNCGFLNIFYLTERTKAALIELPKVIVRERVKSAKVHFEALRFQLIAFAVLVVLDYPRDKHNDPYVQIQQGCLPVLISIAQLCSSKEVTTSAKACLALYHSNIQPYGAKAHRTPAINEETGMLSGLAEKRIILKKLHEQVSKADIQKNHMFTYAKDLRDINFIYNNT